MIWRSLCPGLLETGPVLDGVWAVRRGLADFFVMKAPGGLVCFDAGWSVAGAGRGLAALGMDPRQVAAVFLTHRHWDHAGGVVAYPHAAVYVGEHEKTSAWIADKASGSAWIQVQDGQTVEVAGLSVRVIHTPGHTPGSVSYLASRRFLFSGDTIRLWMGEVVPFMPWLSHDRDAHVRSIRKLALVGGATHILTAHSGVTADAAGAFRRWREAPHAEGKSGCEG